MLVVGCGSQPVPSQAAAPPEASGGPAAPLGTGPAAVDPPAIAFRADLMYLPDEPLLGFVEIPSGPVLMGSDRARDSEAFDDEVWDADTDQGTVQLPAYYVGRYEVTVAQYQACVDDDGCHPGNPESLEGPGEWPVRWVTWPEAREYCEWLEGALTASRLAPDDLTRRLTDGWRLTLPSEAEWAKAARGEDGRIYPWGDSMEPDRANYNRDAGRPTPVGAFPLGASPYGILDMSGNVMEWTRTLYQDTLSDSRNVGEDLETDGRREVRGGSFLSDRRLVRSAYRGWNDPYYQGDYIGFRVVVSPFFPDL